MKPSVPAIGETVARSSALARSAALAHHVLGAELRPEPGRVVARLFLPGEEHTQERSRAAGVVARVLALPEEEIELVAAGVRSDFGGRHDDLDDLLSAHAAIVESHLPPYPISPARVTVIGATFTAEYAVEGAALCNPSAVPHPDQSGLQPGQLRVAVSLRAIGEGHISSIGFASAVVGPGPAWSFDVRARPVLAGVSTAAQWRPEQLRAVLADQGAIDGMTHGILAGLPDPFTEADLEHALLYTPPDLLSRAGGPAGVDLLRRTVASAWEVEFDGDVELSRRTLMPAVAEESNGMEDARFVRFTDDDGAVDYRATYTAYDGQHIAPRLLTSPDLRHFRAHRLAGPAARNKGMALFPRRIEGRYWALCRVDGESNSVSESANGLTWIEPTPVQAPTESWELLQLGNCGPPIETAAGWLVLTHGVGPMRTYSIGAILLDLDDPRRLIGRLRRPLLQTAVDEWEGYVPNVVYSCGGFIHAGRLWMPYGIGDARIGVVWVDVDDLLAEMTRS